MTGPAWSSLTSFWLVASRPDAEQIRRWAQEITAGAQATPLSQIWNRALAWLAERWLRIFGGRAGRELTASLDVLAIVALALVVAVLLVALLRARRRAKSAGRLDGAGEHEQVAPLDPESAHREAAALAAAGAYRDAVRLRYRAMLLRLDAAGRLRYLPARTNGEALAAMAGASFYDSFRGATLVFDRIWYGMRPADASTFGNLETLCVVVETAGRAP